jgi:hypothetical protein
MVSNLGTVESSDWPGRSNPEQREVSMNHKSRSKHTLNTSLFVEPLSKEARYWIGMLLADGNIYTKRQGQQEYKVLQFGLKLDDIEHIRKFARAVGVLEESVRAYGKNSPLGKDFCAKVCFAAKELASQLAAYGITERKSLNEVVPESLALDHDFWRGMVDGDGSIGLYPYGRVNGKPCLYPQLHLCGSYQTIEKFTDFLLTITGFKPAICPCRSIFFCGLAGPKAKTAISAIYYDDCSPVLDRKMIIAKNCKQWQPNRLRLTTEEILIIRNSTDSCYKLATRFYTSAVTVQKIRRGITYKNL